MEAENVRYANGVSCFLKEWSGHGKRQSRCKESSIEGARQVRCLDRWRTRRTQCCPKAGCQVQFAGLFEGDHDRDGYRFDDKTSPSQAHTEADRYWIQDDCPTWLSLLP